MKANRDNKLQESKTGVAGVSHIFLTNKSLQVLELVAVFVVGASAILTGIAIFGGGTVASIGSVWAANLLMLAVIYGGLRSRGQRWAHFGLQFGRRGLKSIGISVLQSLLIFVAAILAFAAGAILMASLVGMKEPADMSKYNYLRGNLPMTILALGSVYFVSAFAEEVIYRGFLITRITELAGGEKSAACFAIVISSLVFGLIHSEWGLAGMVQATCMGLALGTSYFLVKRNLWSIILAHAYMDTILVLQMYYALG
jgi:membrane protease YdiL (CAAX protease family)